MNSRRHRRRAARRHPIYGYDACRNPRCQDLLQTRMDRRVKLCASCRLAGRWGAIAAWAIALLIQIVRGLL